MITVLTLTLIGFILGIIHGIIEGYDFVDKLFLSAVSALFGVAIGLCVGFAVAYMLPEKSEHRIIETIQITAINDGTSSHYIFGSGGTSDEYKYYRKTKQGYKMEDIPVNRAEIRYSDSVRIEVWDYIPKPEWQFGIDLNVRTYLIYVPEGSIKEQFNFDLQ